MRDKFIMKRISSIVFTLIFMITATCFVYMPKHNEVASALAFLNNIENFYLVSTSEGVVLEKNYPVSDKVGMTTLDNEFTIVNDTNSTQQYRLILLTGEEYNQDKLLKNNTIRYSISVDGEEYTEPQTLNENGIIYMNSINAHTSGQYKLKIWLNKDAEREELEGKLFKGIIKLEG